MVVAPAREAENLAGDNEIQDILYGFATKEKLEKDLAAAKKRLAEDRKIAGPAMIQYGEKEVKDLEKALSQKINQKKSR